MGSLRKGREHVVEVIMDEKDIGKLGFTMDGIQQEGDDSYGFLIAALDYANNLIGPSGGSIPPEVNMELLRSLDTNLVKAVFRWDETEVVKFLRKVSDSEQSKIITL